MDQPEPSSWKVSGPFEYNTDTPLPPKADGAIRFVCVSDTHSRTHLPEFPKIPDGDVFVHCGDFTQDSLEAEHSKFVTFLKALPHPTKIVTGGNHDACLDPEYYNKSWSKMHGHKTQADAVGIVANLKGVCTYLQHEETSINGVKTFVSPHTIGDWVFGYKSGSGKPLWEQIPTDTVLLVTHTPPLGIQDENLGSHLGCGDLLGVVQKIKPVVHVFGHIHEGYGHQVIDGTLFINCATVNKFRKPKNAAVVFDLYK